MRVKLLLSYGLVAVITALSVILIFQYTSIGELRSFMLRGGMVGVEDLAGTLEEYYQQNGGWEGVEALLPGGRGMGRMMMGSSIRVADKAGKIVADTQGVSGKRISLLDRSRAVILRDAQNRIIGYLLVEGGMMSGQNSAQLLNRLTQASIWAGVIGGITAVVLALILSNLFLSPLKALIQASQQMAAGNLSVRVPEKGKDELALLARAFNHMADSLQKAENNRKAMTADIAHELRTPIAVQRAHLEALQDGIYPLTPENLQPVLDQTEFLARLVEDLRMLALADAGQIPLEKREISPVHLAQKVYERFRPEAEGKSIQLQIVNELPGIVPAVWGDEQRIEQILNNLLSNALRFTPEAGNIRLRLLQDGNFMAFVVEDTGPGIAPEDLPFIFERFYRGNRNLSHEGTGLGLAIARHLAIAHGGSLEAGNRPEGGAVFTLRLPLSC
ncbi:cell wall metabolism sensor histidine kinase WalK [Anaerolinea thermophila]|uniref:sensor histidine kinase n=3 Tax=Anaerolinea TaxID=233189 RepID=UPI0026ED3D45|nr:ATP-binding protein [Anaerolinea thermophila]